MRAAVADVVNKQVEAGVDLVNDGEMSKPSYTTYVKDRLTGFGGTGNTFVYQDLVDFPAAGAAGVRRSGPLAPQDAGLQRCRSACATQLTAQTDADNLKAALGAAKAHGGFMSAASPGVVSLFFRNDYYKDFETYIYAIADAMRHEYETIANAGFVLQIDCPDLAMGRHIQYADLDLADFRKRAQLHVEALNHAVRTFRPSSCACISAGATMKARIIATCRSPTSSTSCFRRGRTRSHSRRPTRATRMNGRCSSA